MKKNQKKTNVSQEEIAVQQLMTGVEESLGMSITLYDKETGNHIENLELAFSIGTYLKSQLEILEHEGFNLNVPESLTSYATQVSDHPDDNEACVIPWNLHHLGFLCENFGISFVATLEKPIAGIRQLESEGYDFTILTTDCIELLDKESSRKDRTFIDFGSDCISYFKTKGKLIRGIDLEYCADVLCEVCNTHSEKAADWLSDIIDNLE